VMYSWDHENRIGFTRKKGYLQVKSKNKKARKYYLRAFDI
jgi:hypothetical protein